MNIKICEKCHRKLCVEKLYINSSNYFSLINSKDAIKKGIRLSCCNIRDNSISSEIYGFAQYHLQNWYYSKNEFQEAEKKYNLLKNYSKYEYYGKYKMLFLDFFKLKDAGDNIKSLFLNIEIEEWQCPYFTEHQLYDWNKNVS